MALARKWPDLNLDLNRFPILVDLKPRLIPVVLNLDLPVDRKQHMLPQQLKLRCRQLQLQLNLK